MLRIRAMNEPSHKKSLAVSLQAAALIALLPASQTGHAQSERLVLEEITVTAQRREQSLQEVGVSATAISGQRIRDQGITDATKIGSVVPGVEFVTTSGGSTFGTMSVRGVAQSDYSSNQESPNAIYFDEVYLASNAASTFATYDLERIEVLRGPQGTLFGRNSTGGLAHFVSAKPTEEFEGYSELGAGEYGQYWLEGAISGPISDRVRGRIAGRWEQADGYWENRAPGGEDSFETDSRGIRGHLELDVTEDLLARLSLGYDERPKSRAGTYNGLNFYVDDRGLPAPQPSDLDAYGAGPGANAFGYRYEHGKGPKGAFNDGGFLESDNLLSTLMLQWSHEELTVTALSNYTDFNFDYLDDCDASPIDFCRSGGPLGLSQWSQEIHVTADSGPVVWTAGVYYLDIDVDATQTFFFPLLSGSDFAFDDFNTMEQDTTSWATFGQVEWSFAEAFRLIAGIRFTKDEKTVDSKVYFRELGNGYSGGTGSTVFVDPLLVYDFSEATAGGLAEQEDDLWSGKLQLEYTASDSALLYAGLSRGVKGAGFNTNLGAGLTFEETSFSDESLLAYEVGGKFDLRDGSLRLNTSLFYYDYSDYQGFAYNGIQGVVSNYDGRMWGGEIEIEERLPFDVLLSLGVAYVDTELEDVPNAYRGVGDAETVLAPEWTVNGMVQKSIELDSGSLLLQWAFDYVDDYYASVENSAATAVEDSLVHNASITWEIESSGISMKAFVNNVTGEDRQTFRYDLISTGGYVGDQYTPSRWAGVSVRKAF
jgi:iron complex outermembrane receptor protein